MKKSTNYPDIAIHMMFFFKVALLQNLISSFKDSFCTLYTCLVIIHLVYTSRMKSNIKINDFYIHIWFFYCSLRSQR